MRSSDWPWGYPWLRGAALETVETANQDLRRLFGQMAALVEKCPSVPLLFAHPEDLGSAEMGSPSSIWQLPELRLWANKWGLKRYATHQCRCGQSEFAHPLGL